MMHPEEGVIQKDSWDRRQYASLREQSPVLKEIDLDLAERITGPLVEDTWASLFKMRPELVPERETPVVLRALRQVMEQLMSLPEYQEARQWTRLDEWASALAAAHLARKVEEWLKEQPETGGSAGIPVPMAGGLPQGSGGGGQSGQQGRQQPGNQPDGQGAQQPGGQQGSQAHTGFPEQALAALASKLQEGLKELGDVAGLLWGTEPGQPRRLAGRQMEEADWLLRDQRFLRMARMAGRMYTAALTRKLQRGREGVIRAGITLGSDLTKVLPEELVALRHPVLRKDFLARYAEGRLRQYEVRGAQQERGPIVCCVDTSGSMLQHGGHKHEWAKAVALALYRVARRERRGFVGVIFDATACGPFHLNSEGEVIRFAELALGGGTNFRAPLVMALKAIGRQRKADVVFITDGEAEVHSWKDWFAKEKARLGFRVFGVHVGGNPSGLAALREFSDEVLRVEPRPDGEGLEVVFDEV